MTHSNQLSTREKEVAGFLLQGKSNKQIALLLGVTEHTVEFHLKNVYAKLNVSSRVEAILKLRETAGILGDSAVEETAKTGNTAINHGKPEEENKDGSGIARKISLADIIRFLTTYKVPVFIWILLSAVLALTLLRNRTPEMPPQECEYPDESTVGQVMQRSNASGGMVHGQFGTIPAWPAQPGYVKYSIKTPRADHLFLQLRYSKFSASSVNILIYLDDELSPRASLLPVDQGDWNKFIWSDSIDLGSVERGVHSIKFYTDGQVYGVADLDEFTLTTEPP